MVNTDKKPQFLHQIQLNIAQLYHLNQTTKHYQQQTPENSWNHS